MKSVLFHFLFSPLSQAQIFQFFSINQRNESKKNEKEELNGTVRIDWLTRKTKYKTMVKMGR